MSVDVTAKRPARMKLPRHFLMCRPAYFDVTYSINPWMKPDQPTSTPAALDQWKRLHDLFVDLGHTVEQVTPIPGLPDMVFSANGAFSSGGRALVARFRHAQRADEAPAYLEWFRARGWDVRQAALVNEGQGDFLLAGEHILAGSGFRTDPHAHDEVAEFFGRPVVGLSLVDPRFYHLDTALAVLNDNEIMLYPPAFDPPSRKMLADLFPDAIEAGEADALVFGLNAVSDGRNVVLAQQALRLADQLHEHGFNPIGVDLSELLKGGGGIKCCTLELHAG